MPLIIHKMLHSFSLLSSISNPTKQQHQHQHQPFSYLNSWVWACLSVSLTFFLLTTTIAWTWMMIPLDLNLLIISSQLHCLSLLLQSTLLLMLSSLLVLSQLHSHWIHTTFSFLFYNTPNPSSFLSHFSFLHHFSNSFLLSRLPQTTHRDSFFNTTESYFHRVSKLIHNENMILLCRYTMEITCFHFVKCIKKI